MAGPRGLPRSAWYGGALLCGALPILAFPAPNWSWLAWFGLVPGLLLMRSASSAGRGALTGWWFGAGYLLAALYWLIPNLGPGLLPIVTILGLLWAGAGAACQVLLRAPLRAGRAAAAMVVVPACWVVSEWLRSWQGFGGPWAVLGASQWQHPVVLSLAAVGGVWLVTAALVLANTGLAVAVLGVAERRWAAGLAGLGGTAVALVAGPVAFALLTAPGVARELTVALVQPGITSPAVRDTASQRLSVGLGRYHPGLIAWGESSIASDLRTDPVLLGQLERLSAADGAQLLVNQDTIIPGNGKSKVAVLVGPGGIAGTYTKTRLVPFGEYIPFRSQLGWLTRVSRAAPQNMIPGSGAKVLTASVPGGPLRFGVLICFESAFPDMARADVQLGAQLIVYQTSDSTFQASWQLAQHASLVAVRAAETGRPAVQAALTGDSVAFDAQGRLLAWASGDFRGVRLVRFSLPPAGYRTPFDRYGPYTSWICVIIVVVAGLLAAGRAGRRNRAAGRGFTRIRGRGYCGSATSGVDRTSVQ
ncbi:MAG TPA: apolipoprotein N-acyltransferase [Streptosporangiaceae bacterium]|jgi:apolipoprotein N-acyltransferase|nr:apolipoprotein N-acyltransferase [Streptosporangiaceae bacterium]